MMTMMKVMKSLSSNRWIELSAGADGRNGWVMTARNSLGIADGLTIVFLIPLLIASV